MSRKQTDQESALSRLDASAECSGEADACRPGCGACCIAPSISSPIPGMPSGKPAGVRCVQLTDDHLCALYGNEERPAVCISFRFTREFCGRDREEALRRLRDLETETAVKV